MVKEATIKLSSSFKQKLEDAKNGDETFEDVLRRLLSGYDSEIESKTQEQVAFCLEHRGYADNGECWENHFLTVTYHELKNSKVGDVFEPESSNYAYHGHESATVICKTDDCCIIKFFAEICDETGTNYENEVMAYHYF